MKVLSVVGARPQFIKSLPVSVALRQDLEEVLVHTGQHYDHEMSAVFFEELDVAEPAYNLGVGSGPPGEQIGAMTRKLEPIVSDESPDVVLVYGDTNSTLAAAVVGAHSGAHVAHVEAGLRSHNRSMPEEINRVLTDHAADLLFAPTTGAVENLRSEGLAARTYRTGDVMYDALLGAREAAEKSSILSDLGVSAGEYLLVTVHRAGNTDDPDRLHSIVDALVDTPHPVVFPIHPRTVGALETIDRLDEVREKLLVIDPVGYFDFIALLDGAERFLTDSGGAQKEAFFLDTPCVTLRAETEWTETVEAGWNVLVDADTERILSAIDREFDLSEKPQPYGDGNAAAEIKQVLVDTVPR